MEKSTHLIYILKDKPIKCKFNSQKYESQKYDFPASSYSASYTCVYLYLHFHIALYDVTVPFMMWWILIDMYVYAVNS